MLRSVILAGALALAALAMAPAQASLYRSRQYYSGWRHNSSDGYYYRSYYYKPRSDYSGYRHHYVIYYPSRPRYYYYYNPYKKHYWGRCPVETDGKEEYSMLAEGDRKASLDDIPEKAFPKPGRMPRIPDADEKDDERVDLPPDDLPGRALPKGGRPRPKPKPEE
jgi:hypothetical protein